MSIKHLLISLSFLSFYSSLWMETASAQELIHKDEEPQAREVFDNESLSFCDSFLLIEDEDFYLFVFNGVFGSETIVYLAVKDAIDREEYSSGIVREIYSVGLLAIPTRDQSEEINGLCAWIPPLTPAEGGFGGYANCRLSLDDNPSTLEYRGSAF